MRSVKSSGLQYNKDWMREARYGKSKSRYLQVCAVAHRSTGGKCICCNRPSEELHHAQYFSWWQLVIDIIAMLKGKQVELPVWQPGGRGPQRKKLGGLVQGREVVGWSAFPMSKVCHDRIHRRQHWLSFDNEVQHCWSARNKWWTLWRLRLLWQLKKVRG